MGHLCVTLLALLQRSSWIKVAFDVSKCFKRKILSSRSFGLRREVQFPDFVLTQFLCFGTNFVAFCINHNTKPFRTSENTYLLPVLDQRPKVYGRSRRIKTYGYGNGGQSLGHSYGRRSYL